MEEGEREGREGKEGGTNQVVVVQVGVGGSTLELLSALIFESTALFRRYFAAPLCRRIFLLRLPPLGGCLRSIKLALAVCGVSGKLGLLSAAVSHG